MKHKDYDEIGLIDYTAIERPSKAFLEVVEDITELPDSSNARSRDYIMRNGHKYYKTKKPYVYRTEGGNYVYRLYHKQSKTNTFVTKDIITGEKFHTQQQASEALQEHIFKLTKSATFKNRKVTFGDVWEEVKRTTAKEEATITKYESIYKHHISFEFGNIPVQDITYQQVNDYLEKMYKMGDGRGSGQNGYSYTFTESILKFFWLVFQHSFAQRVLSADELKILTDNIKMPRNLENKGLRILTYDEIQKIYNLLKDTDYLLVFLVSLYTGARPAESFAVRFSDFDFENKTLSINKQIVEFQGTLTFKECKTFSRVVDVPQFLIDEARKRYDKISAAQKVNPNLFILNRKKVVYDFKNDKGIKDIYDDMIMTDSSGRYNAYSSFQYYAKIIRKEICPNISSKEDFSFYTFRKTAISIMASHSIPIGALMRITGHKKNETLFKYYYSDENEFAQRKINESVNSMETLIEFQ